MLFLHEMDLLLRRCQTNFCHLFFGLLDSSFTLILHASLVDCYLRGDGVVGGFGFCFRLREVSFVDGGFAVPPCDEVTRRVWLVDMFFW